jgi:phage shock protein A
MEEKILQMEAEAEVVRLPGSSLGGLPTRIDPEKEYRVDQELEALKNRVQPNLTKE